MSGTVIDRLQNIQNELMQIDHQCARENQMSWPLVPVMSAVEQALDEYIAKSHARTAQKSEKGVV